MLTHHDPGVFQPYAALYRAIMPKRIQNLPDEYGEMQRSLAQSIGARVRARRREMDLTQEHLRARMELEQVYISRTQYSRIENGDVLPNAAELIALQSILKVPFDWLLLGVGSVASFPGAISGS